MLLTKLRFCAKSERHSQPAGASQASLDSQRAPPQVIGMSGTLPNGAAVAAWLGAALFQCDYRPVPLSKALLVGCELRWAEAGAAADGDTGWRCEPVALEGWPEKDVIGFLVSQTVRELKSVLVRGALRLVRGPSGPVHECAVERALWRPAAPACDEQG